MLPVGCLNKIKIFNGTLTSWPRAKMSCVRKKFVSCFRPKSVVVNMWILPLDPERLLSLFKTESCQPIKNQPRFFHMTGVISRLNHWCFYHPRINFVYGLLVKRGDEITPTKIQRFVSHHNSNSVICETIQFFLIKRKTIVHQIKGMFTDHMAAGLVLKLSWSAALFSLNAIV